MGVVAPGVDARGSGERWGDRSGGAGVERGESAMEGAGDGPRDCNSGGATIAAGTGGRRSRLIPRSTRFGSILFEWIGGPILGGSS